MAGSLDFVENALTCSICLDTLRTPRTLPCLHTFCEECIQSVITNSESRRRVSCPDCRQKATLSVDRNIPANEIAKHLPLNFAFQKLIEEVDGRKKAKAREQICEQIEICCDHAPEKLKFYCFIHAMIVCKKCIEKKHKNCSTVSIEEAIDGQDERTEHLAVIHEVETIKKEIEGSMDILRKNIDGIIQEIDRFPVVVKGLEADFRNIVNKVCQTAEANSEELKKQHTKKQEEKFGDCVNWLAALETMTTEMQYMYRHGTRVQQFIAAEQMKDRLKDFKKIAKCITGSVQHRKVILELIEVLKGVLNIGEELLGRVETIKSKENEGE